MDWMLLVQGGPSAAFLGLVIWLGRLYFTGNLQSKVTVDDLKANFQQQIAREREISDSWKLVAQNGQEALAKLTIQNDKLLESQQTVEAFVLAIPRVSMRELGPGPGGRAE